MTKTTAPKTTAPKTTEPKTSEAKLATATVATDDAGTDRVGARPASTNAVDLVQGSLDMLILRVLELEPLHGWGIAQLIRRRSREVLQVTQGSLYPALHRLERRGLVEAHWATTENNRRAKYYQLTRLGHGRLAEESANWQRMVEAVSQVMQTTEVLP